MRSITASGPAHSPSGFFRWPLFLLSLLFGAFIVRAAAPGMHHATASGEVFLGGNYIELGVRANGAFGSAGNKPGGFTGSTIRSNIGMVTDLDRFGMGTVQSFDFFLPGGPFVGWGAGYKISGTPTSGQNKDDNTPVTDIPVSSLTDTSSGTTASATCVAVLNSSLEITQDYSLNESDRFFTIHITLRNVSASAMTDVRYQWGVDPDNTKDIGGSYTTVNTILQSIAAGDGKAAVEAASTGSSTVANLFLYCTDAGAIGAVNPAWTVDVYNSALVESAQAKNYTVTQDRAIFMTVVAGALNPGASYSFDFVVGMSRDSLSQLEAQMAGGQPPEITSASSASGTVNSAFSYQITALNTPTSYSVLEGTLPTGVTLDTSTGLISGTPATGGTINLTIAAINASGSGSAPLTLNIAKLNQTVSISPVSSLAIGQSTTITAAATSGLAVTYSVTSGNASFSGANLTANDGNPVVIRATQAGNGAYNSAYAELTLSATKLAQAITFAAISDKDRSDGSFILGASASSGLPVTLTVASGPATISGTTLTLTGDGGDVTVTATQAGNASYYVAAPVSRSFHVTKKNAQTITFPVIADKLSNAAAFNPGATASSGLPVTYTLVSGPAMLSGSTVTLTGAPGTVTLRASQAGDTSNAAAADVTRSFQVTVSGPRVFFGLINGKDSLAGVLAQDGLTGSLIGFLSSTNEGFVVSLTLGNDGYYTGVATTFAGKSSGSTGGLRIESLAATRSFRAKLDGLVLSGSITELALDFSATQDAPIGVTAGIAGYYTVLSISTVSGNIYTVVGTQGTQYVLAVTNTLVAGATLPIDAFGNFNAPIATGATLSGKVYSTDMTEVATLAQSGQPSLSLLGLNTSTTRTDRLINLSARTLVDDSVPANGTLVAGFVITGSEPKKVLLRGVGPTLKGLGIQNALSDPKIKLFNSTGTLLAQNDDWGNDPTISATASRVGAFPLTPGSKDASLIQTLNPGIYTMTVSDSGGSGIALAEIYDASENPQANYQRLMNISARGLVSSGEGVLIAGFVVTGNSPKRVLIRAVGPGLSKYGMSGVLADPQVTLYDSKLNVIVRNDNWGISVPSDAKAATNTTAEISTAVSGTGAFALDSGSKDASVIIALAPGAYTAMVSGPTGTSGVALVEVYELP